MSRMSLTRSPLTLITCLLIVAAVGCALLGGGDSRDDASGPSGSAAAGQGRQPSLRGSDLGGNPPPPRSEAEGELDSYLRRGLAQGGGERAVSPMKAHREIAGAPGGVEALMSFALETEPLPDDDVLTYAIAIVTRYLATADLQEEEREKLASLVLGRLESYGVLSPPQTLAGLEWVWRLGGQVVGPPPTAQWDALVIQAGSEVLSRGDLRAARALARLNVAPGLVAEATFAVLRSEGCEHVSRQCYLLVDPALQAVLRSHGTSVEGTLISKIESCNLPCASVTGIVLRAARRDSWSSMRARLGALAEQESLPSADFALCLREALIYDPGQAIRELPALLDLRPHLRVRHLGALLDPSLGWLSSVEQMSELIRGGALRWDADALRLRMID